MRKLNLFLSFAFIGACSLVSAALPPLYQSVAEIKQILSDGRLATSLSSGQMIQGISKTDTGYLITTPRYLLCVDVIYQSSGRMGPIQFELVFHDPVEKTSQ